MWKVSCRLLVKRRSRRVRTFLSVNKRRDTEGRGGEAESADILYI